MTICYYSVMFIGRKSELHQLQEFQKRKVAGIVVVCGRRRIGKSTLIENFAKGSCFLEFYGLAPREGLTMQHQLDHFGELLGLAFQRPAIKFAHWNEAFDALANLTREGPVIILLDEISWMAGSDKDFVGKLKGVWDTKFKKNRGLILILCGSVTSWIEDNILHDKEFMGRVSLALTLEEMPLYDANQFWGSHLISAYEKFKILCVTGGIPCYLEEIHPHETAEQNIKRLCFTKGGILVEEFDKIFRDIFNRQAEDYRKIVEILIEGACGYDELCHQLGVERTGGLSHKLQVLCQSGFLTRQYIWEKNQRKPKLSKFRLKDNYLRFYLKYILPKKHLIDQGLYEELFLDDLPEWHTIMGLQFENLVLNNLSSLLKILQIPPSAILSAAPYFQAKTKRHESCQIDLLIQCRNSLYVCEMKLGQKISSQVIDDIKEKITKLSIPKGVSVRSVLIYQGELAPQIKQLDYINYQIPFEQFLN